MRYVEKFEGLSSGLSYTFPLNRYQWDTSQNLNAPVLDLADVDFGVDQIGNNPAKRMDATETIRIVPVLATAALAEAERDSMTALLWRIGRGKLYVLNTDGSRYWSYGRITKMVNISVEVGNRRHFTASIQFRRSSDWYATTKTAPAATSVTTNPKQITVTNPGNYPAQGSSGIVTLLKSGAPTGWGSSINIENLSTQESILLGGTIITPTGVLSNWIKIDHAAKSIYKSADAGVTWSNNLWPYVTLGDQNGFGRYEPGDNTIQITVTVASPNYSFETSFWPAY